MKKTPLHSAHRRAGAKMVEFAGWEMPVQYDGVIAEHLAVRNRAGLFDVSHMGELEVRGSAALESCQRLTANDLGRMKNGQAQYNLLLNENGGIVDDVIFYRIASNHFLVCVNAANTGKDFEWIKEHVSNAVELTNVSAAYAQLALQGPLAERILQPLTALRLSEMKPFSFAHGEVSSVPCLTARTGYTGEDGFELYCASEMAERLWDALLEAGEPQGMVLAGLGARDTLRLEKAYPLYGHELDDHTTPLEANLEWVTKFSKPEFMGRDRLLRQKSEGVRRKLVGLELLDAGIARREYPLFNQGRRIGQVTSGTRSPTLGCSIALGYVSVEESHLDSIIEVEIRARKARAKIVSLPFYRR